MIGCLKFPPIGRFVVYFLLITQRVSHRTIIRLQRTDDDQEKRETSYTSRLTHEI
jgi:hypothetical protein